MKKDIFMKKEEIFLKKWQRKFHPPPLPFYSVPFLSVLHQNKTFV